MGHVSDIVRTQNKSAVNRTTFALDVPLLSKALTLTKRTLTCHKNAIMKR